MGTIILSAAFQGVLIATWSLMWTWLSQRLGMGAGAGRWKSVVVIGAASLVSVTAYIIFHYNKLSVWADSYLRYEHNAYFIETFLNTPHFRNAIFGALIAVLTYLWLEHRRRYIEVPFSENHSKWLRLTELNLVLLVVVTFVAIILAEFPGILRFYKVTLGEKGIVLQFREQADPWMASSAPANGGSPAHSIASRQLSPLEWFHTSAGQAERDALYVCELALKRPTDQQNAGNCAAAAILGEYSRSASQLTKPILECLAIAIAPHRDQGLTNALVHPLATAYIHGVFTWEIESVPADATDHALAELTSALIYFGERLPGYGLLEEEECTEAHAVAMELRDFPEGGTYLALRRTMELSRILPYDHINHAIFSMFLGSARDGIFVLQRWQDKAQKRRQDLLHKEGIAEEALAWTSFIARFYQNGWIYGLTDGELKPVDKRKVHTHDPGSGARDILDKFRPDFVDNLHKKHYCKNSNVNHRLFIIYYQYLYNVQVNLYHLFRSHGEEILHVFDEHSQVHRLADELAGVERLKRCFEKVVGKYRALLDEAIASETLGEYKSQYATFVERRERDTYPESMPEELRKQAIEHFDSALTLIHEAKKERNLSPHHQSPRVEVLYKLLAEVDVANAGIIRIRGKRDAVVRQINR